MYTMDLDTFVEIVETMVLQHDYPGFEARSLKLGLPEQVLKAPAKLFGEALSHRNVYVKLAALRWFQERTGAAKAYANAISRLLKDTDDWVRLEAIQTLERFSNPSSDLAFLLAPLLKDHNADIRKSAAKALGKISSKTGPDNETVIAALREAALDHDTSVRFKAQKALRRLGHYTT